MLPSRKEISYLRRKIIIWFKKHGRVFPWRQTKDPFCILIAEMMLRRTKADQVISVYDNFLRKFKDINMLADADINQVRNILYPLGLSWRIPGFIKMARELREKYQSRIPSNREQLKSLPGVGDYVAGAVLSFAYDKNEWIVDSNIVRIFRRFFGISTSHEGRRDRHIIEIAKNYSSGPDIRSALFGILDLAALVCHPRDPYCKGCPLKKKCFYYSQRLC